MDGSTAKRTRATIRSFAIGMATAIATTTTACRPSRPAPPATSPRTVAVGADPSCPHDAAAADSVSRTAYYEFQVVRFAEVLDDGFRARRGPTEGEVLAEFVVDTAGRVETGTVKMLRAADARLVAQVRALLPELRFTPAELVRGCPVRQIVQYPFRFY